jgi:tetratricopeptide (TPR) repeat protein
MLRKILAGTTLLAAISCAGPDAVTSPETGGDKLAAANGPSCSAGQGQELLDAGRYKQAIIEFGCVIDSDPTGIDGYRGRAEAELMLGLFSDAAQDYARVNAFVVPVHPDAAKVIISGYEARLDAAPDDIQAMTSQSFAYWWFFDYAAAIHVLDHLLAVAPNDVYGNLFMGSSSLLRGRNAGLANLNRAIELAPGEP